MLGKMMDCSIIFLSGFIKCCQKCQGGFKLLKGILVVFVVVVLLIMSLVSVQRINRVKRVVFPLSNVNVRG